MNCRTLLAALPVLALAMPATAQSDMHWPAAQVPYSYSGSADCQLSFREVVLRANRTELFFVAYAPAGTRVALTPEVTLSWQTPNGSRAATFGTQARSDRATGRIEARMAARPGELPADVTGMAVRARVVSCSVQPF